MTTTPTDETALSLVQLLDGVLVAVTNRFAAAGVELPERRYWTLHEPAVDCEQFVVSFMNLFIGPPGDEAALPQRCNSPRSATLHVQVMRCVPTVGPRSGAPTPQAIQDASHDMAIDSWLLLDAAPDCDQWGGTGLGVLATVNAIEPEGGIGGSQMVLTVAVP